ncbi:ABC transporter permease [Nesterenkonia populi]|uniref:ABC transporter permease n=1 Tax=Nesterenkonia populi TaxID=1591087 RepID=UPI0011BD8C39|nr:ABC transporter permease [Nesterenkonia populi]
MSEVTAVEEVEGKQKSPLRGNVLGRFTPTGLLSMLFLAVVLILAFVVPLLPNTDPFAQQLGASLVAPFVDATHVLGTDQLGRDILSRVAVATRTSFLIGVGSVAISALLGLLLGLISGYRGGRLDNFLMATADITLAIPTMLLLIVVVAALGPDIWMLTILLGIMNWVVFGRLVRSMVLSLREQDFVAAARSAGGSAPWIIRKHLLRAVTPELLVTAGYQLGIVITIESSLSYLGLGVPPPNPSLGLLIAEGQAYLQTSPHLVIAPATVAFLLIAGAQFLSQGVRAGNRRQ